MQYFKFRDLGPTEDGEERMLAWDMNAIGDFELEMGGASIYKLLREAAGFHFLRTLIWAGLKWQDPALTPHAVGELIQKHVIDKKRPIDELVEVVIDTVRKSEVLPVLSKAKAKGEVVESKRPTPRAQEPVVEEYPLAAAEAEEEAAKATPS